MIPSKGRMYSAKLTEPRRKRRRHDEVRQQTFPVPISSLTGIDASNDTWRWYEATLDQNSVKVSDDDAIKMLSTMGFFGQVRNSGASEEKFVSVDKFDPILNVSSDENVESGSVETADDKTEMSSGESDVEVEETKAKGWGKWKASEQEKEVLILDSFDAFFLAYGLGCLLVRKTSDDDDDDHMSLDALWAHFCQSDANFRHRYAAYHHFRAKNWIVRSGTKFGNDFLLYKDGPPFYHASYSVRVQKNGPGLTNLTWSELSALNRVTESAAKELLIVEVDEKNSKIKDNCSAGDYLNNVSVKEVLVRRWVASQKREDD